MWSPSPSVQYTRSATRGSLGVGPRRFLPDELGDAGVPQFSLTDFGDWCGHLLAEPVPALERLEKILRRKGIAHERNAHLHAAFSGHLHERMPLRLVHDLGDRAVDLLLEAVHLRRSFLEDRLESFVPAPGLGLARRIGVGRDIDVDDDVPASSPSIVSMVVEPKPDALDDPTEELRAARPGFEDRPCHLNDRRLVERPLRLFEIVPR